MMEIAFTVNRFCRGQLDGYFEKYSLAQLNKIPAGFSNNLIWNIGHVVVTQQLIVNKLSGLPLMVPEEMIARYMRGTRPAGEVSREEADSIRAFIFRSLETTERAIKDSLPQTFTSYTTSTGYSLGSLPEAVQFNNYHEATHLGIMMGIRKFV